MPYTLDDLARSAELPVGIQVAVADAVARSGPVDADTAGHLAASGVHPDALARVYEGAAVATTPWAFQPHAPSWVSPPGTEIRLRTAEGVTRGVLLAGDAEVAVVRPHTYASPLHTVHPDEVLDAELSLGLATDRPRSAMERRRDVGGAVGGVLAGMGTFLVATAVLNVPASVDGRPAPGLVGGMDGSDQVVVLGAGLGLVAAGGLTLAFTLPDVHHDHLDWLDDDAM